MTNEKKEKRSPKKITEADLEYVRRKYKTDYITLKRTLSPQDENTEPDEVLLVMDLRHASTNSEVLDRYKLKGYEIVDYHITPSRDDDRIQRLSNGVSLVLAPKELPKLKAGKAKSITEEIANHAG